MAKNDYGFIQKKYRQPIRYDKMFSKWNALYLTNQGKTIMVEAIPHFLCSNMQGAKIDHYEIIVQEGSHRALLNTHITTQKRAMELIEKYITQY